MNQQTGIARNVDAETYHAGPGVSNSMLSAMAQSPAHCYALYLAPNRPQRKPTPAMSAGTLAHTVILEPGEVAKRYAVRPPGLDMRTKDGKAWLASLPPDVLPIDADQMAAAESQRDAVMSLAELGPLVFGDAEVSVYWVDPESGVQCRARPDMVCKVDDNTVDILDLKTTTDASPEAFSKTIARHGYHRQAAHYSRGYALASGKTVRRFVFGVVTSAYPFIAAAYVLDADALQQGEDECAELLHQYAECQRTGVWPAYGDGANIIGLPVWARRSSEIEVGYV